MKYTSLLVLGGGESGTGAAMLAKTKGMGVFLSDAGSLKPEYKNVLLHHEIPFEEKGHQQALQGDFDLVVKSPGIPDTHPVVMEMKSRNLKIISEIEFAGYFNKAKTICITGSNGKTTTTMLTWHMLRKAGLNVGLAGNVGKSFAWQVATEDFDVYVLEISSFQLDGMFDFRADIAVLLNITPDHLDRYQYDFTLYAASKFRIWQNHSSSQYLVYCMDDKVICEGIEMLRPPSALLPFSLHQQPNEGAFVSDDKLIFQTKEDKLIMDTIELSLKGKHNLYNSMASGIVGRIMDIRKEVIKESLSDFQNVEHRLEVVSTVRGIQFINDSKATNVNSTWYALESMTQPVILILGGQDKGNDYSILKELVERKVKAIVCLGVDNQNIKMAFKDSVRNMVETQSAEDAVRAAYLLGAPGDVVLLSPACASFDLFKNYEDRGQQFKNAVRDL